ncbi:hypothetical protein JCM11491_007045 [Sporobolomyces phaffii]
MATSGHRTLDGATNLAFQLSQFPELTSLDARTWFYRTWFRGEFVKENNQLDEEKWEHLKPIRDGLYDQIVTWRDGFHSRDILPGELISEIEDFTRLYRGTVSAICQWAPLYGSNTDFNHSAAISQNAKTEARKLVKFVGANWYKIKSNDAQRGLIAELWNFANLTSRRKVTKSTCFRNPRSSQIKPPSRSRLMESLGGFVDPSLSTPRPSTPASSTPAAASTPSASIPSDSSLSGASSNDPAAATTTTTLDLDKEVQNVIAGFGSFWGKVRKQSTAAFANAEKQLESTRKDLNPLLSKAKANLDTFSTAARAEVQRLSEVQQPPTTGGGGVVIGADGLPMIIGGEEEPQKLDKGKGVDRSESSPSTSSTENPAAAASAFFSKIQTQLSSMQDQAPQALHALSSNFTQFQDQLSHLNLKNSTAEEYLHKGEHWLNEFKDEVSKLAKEAVQIVPPSLSGQAADEVRDSRKSEDFSVMKGMTRKDTLLYRLRSDPSVFLVNPALPPLPSSNDLTDLRAAYSSFVSTLPSDFMTTDLVKTAKEQGGDVLEQTRLDVTTGEGDKVGEEEFWKRYLFRVHLIDEEEEKRKKVLSVTQPEEDDFSWDMDDEETTASSTTNPTSPAPVAAEPAAASLASDSRPSASTPTPTAPDSHSQSREVFPIEPETDEDATPEDAEAVGGPRSGSTPTTTNQSPRTSSSDETRTSYDFVGERSGNPSVDGREEDVEDEPTRVAEVEKKKVVPQEDDDDDDSDWE